MYIWIEILSDFHKMICDRPLLWFLCTQRKLFACILCPARMGNTKKALLRRMAERSPDTVYHAINFCKEHNEQELWDDLIAHSLDKPCEYFNNLDLSLKSSDAFVLSFVFILGCFVNNNFVLARVKWMLLFSRENATKTIR